MLLLLPRHIGLDSKLALFGSIAVLDTDISTLQLKDNAVGSTTVPSTGTMSEFGMRCKQYDLHCHNRVKSVSVGKKLNEHECNKN